MTPPIKIMISSRCNDAFPAGGERLSTLRRRIKQELEGSQLLGKSLFEVWINEDAPPADTSADSVDVCLAQVDKADILLVLSNGNAGWATTAADIGICHAELMRATSRAAAKVRIVSLGNLADDGKDPDQSRRNKRFQAYLETQNFFRGGTVRTADEAVERAREAVFDALQELVRLGGREARKGRFHTGDALLWSRFNFPQRQDVIAETIVTALRDRGGVRLGERSARLTIADAAVLILVHAVPAGLAVPAAREMIGRPFLDDHRHTKALKNAAGPVHLIGCHKGATETQAASLLGFPDATIVPTPFGVYVADPVQKVQFVFIRDCRDEASTRFGVQRLFDWLSQTGEDVVMARRAEARARIVQAIAREQL